MGNITTPLAARPTIYKGIEMRSRLEARWAASLDAQGVSWQYEPVCFAAEGGQYLPDFRISGYGDSRPLYLEVKGVVIHPLPLMVKMEVIWESEPDAYLHIVEGPDFSHRWWRGARGPRFGAWTPFDGERCVAGDGPWPPHMCTGAFLPDAPRIVRL